MTRPASRPGPGCDAVLTWSVSPRPGAAGAGGFRAHVRPNHGRRVAAPSPESAGGPGLGARALGDPVSPPAPVSRVAWKGGVSAGAWDADHLTAVGPVSGCGCGSAPRSEQPRGLSGSPPALKCCSRAGVDFGFTILFCLLCWVSSPRCGRRRTGRPRAAGPAPSGRCAEVREGAPTGWVVPAAALRLVTGAHRHWNVLAVLHVLKGTVTVKRKILTPLGCGSLWYCACN